MTDTQTTPSTPWALGDYHRFAKETVWEVGQVVVDACEITPGERLLDVAAGSGNVAVRAATAGAEVVAADITPENFAAGREEAARAGVEVEWVEGDAQSLPFEDESFEIVTSCFGALFAPDHQAVANELVRVCRPGGRVVMANFTPEGLITRFFGALAPFDPPPPPDFQPPPLWGSEEHVGELFAGRLEPLELSRRSYVETAESPLAYRDLFKQTFGPIVATYQALAGQPDQIRALDRAFLEFAERENQSPAGQPASYPYEYLLVRGTRTA